MQVFEHTSSILTPKCPIMWEKMKRINEVIVNAAYKHMFYNFHGIKTECNEFYNAHSFFSSFLSSF